MAIDFTDNPSNGDTVTADGRTYTYDSTAGVWNITFTEGGGGGGSHTATASGALADGDLVVVNTDGTVSVVDESGETAALGTLTSFVSNALGYPTATFDSTNNKVVVGWVDNASSIKAAVGTVSGTSISFGTAATADSNNGYYLQSTFDSNAGKVVFVYRTAASGAKMTAVVGTVSGTSISFGTPVDMSTSGSLFNLGVTFDSNSNKVVAIYRGPNGTVGTDYRRGLAIVGTVSGTSISFGDEVLFGSQDYTAAMGIDFDSSINKVVIAYEDGSGGSGNTPRGEAIVGTVSGTSISFGTATTFTTNDVDGNVGNLKVVSNNSGKAVVTYHDNGNSSYGTAVVGTVSGTSISFGTPVVYESNTTFEHDSVYVPTADKIIISYRASPDQYGRGIVGTISGTSISFATALNLNETNVNGGQGCTYDSNADKVIVAYDDITNNVGEAIVWHPVTSLTANLTAENYIGISDGVYSDGATATIQVVGSVDDAQSGLTAGQSYYVQTDGTLNLAADDPSVFAGTAVSATEIIVKG